MDAHSFGIERLSNFQAAMRENGLDAALVLKPQNVCYLSGFNPMIQSHPAVVILPARGEAVLLLHALRYRHAEEEAFLRNFRVYGTWGQYGKAAPQDLMGGILAVLNEPAFSGARKWGMEASFMPVAFYRRWESMLPGAGFTDVDSLFSRARMVKHPDEIELIQKAAWIADRGMEAALETVRLGASEIEVSVRCMTAMQEAWKDRYPDLEAVDFGTNEGGVLNALWAYCLSGPRMNFMCDSPKSRRFENGDLVLIIIWTALNGYHAENERTVLVGQPHPMQEKAFRTVLEARETASLEIRPGNPIASVYDEAAKVMTRNGFGDVLPGRVGHGIGLGDGRHQQRWNRLLFSCRSAGRPVEQCPAFFSTDDQQFCFCPTCRCSHPHCNRNGGGRSDN